MSDSEKIETRYHYEWIHNVFGDFVHDTLEFFTTYLYPRFEWKIVGTFDKAVEYINKQNQYGREVDQAMKPGLVLDPSGDFSFDETYGKMLYRFPNLSPGFVKYLYQPIYQDNNVLITSAFSRIVGEFNFIGLMSSFYEYCDMKIYLNLIFGGLERFIYPRWFNSFIIIPDEIKNFTYSNDVTGVSYKLNIENSYSQLVKTTNTNELVYPCSILPRYKLTNMSDASSRLGGSDNLPDWKLNFTISYEVEIPTFLILESDYLAETYSINLKYGSCYSANKDYSTSEEIPVNIESLAIRVSHGMDETSNSAIIIPESAVKTDESSRVFKTRYYYIVTEADELSETNVDISLPEIIDDIDLIKVSGKYGDMEYGDHYEIIEGGTKIRIDKNYVELEESDIIEIFIYRFLIN